MIYHGSRDADTYLEKMIKIKNCDIEHNIMSVCGGMSFLHAIGKNLKKLIVVDRDLENMSHSKAVIDLMKLSADRVSFIRNLIGHEVIVLNNQVIVGSKINKKTFSDEWWFPEKVSDCVVKAKYGSVILNYKDRSLSINNYNILFGYGFLETEKTYSETRECINNLDIVYLNEDFSNIDYSEKNIGNIHCFLLVSNCDNPLYTPSDNIIRRVMKTLSGSIDYISWNRYIKIRPNKNHFDAVRKISRFTSDRDVVELKTYLGYSFLTDELSAKNHIIISSISEINESMNDTFLYHISLTANNSEYLQNILLIFEKIMSKFKRIIFFEFVENIDLCDVLKIFIKQGFNCGYEISSISWTGGKDSISRSYIIVWDMKDEQLF